MKLLTLSTLLVGMYQNPTYALLIAILLVFIADIVSQILSTKPALNLQYEGGKEILNDPSSDNYISEKLFQIECAQVDLNTWSYTDLNTQARLMKIKPKNRKKLTLIKELNSLLV